MRRLPLTIFRITFPCMLWAAGAEAASPLAPAAPEHSKIELSLLKKLARADSEQFIVLLREQADTSGAAAFATRSEKAQHVFEQLRATAARTQAPLLGILAANATEHRRFWITNMILVTGDIDLATSLAERDDVAKILNNPLVRMPLPEPEPAALKSTQAIEWGVAKIRAPELWSAGFTGQGIVVASADTGVDWTHPAIKGKYRGWNGVRASHDYNWHDAIHGSSSVCGGNSPVPCDDGRHGTHTVGTMVGDDGSGNQVGVAPGAKWMGCRNMDQGVGTPASYAECFQFFLAPTAHGGLGPDPSKAPDVINNSWSCPPSEGCTDPAVLKAIVDNVKAAGIVVVASATNSGPGCSSIDDPVAIYDAAFTIGATDAADQIASFSSRGPVIIDGSNRRKPDISAPGVSVRSTTPGNNYAFFSGTSMASPHVAGAIALMLSARPALNGQPAAIQHAFERTAVPRTHPSGCGAISGTAVPNNIYGWGRLDVKAAVDGLTPPNLDIDSSGGTTRYDALTDGVLIVRYLFGATGRALTEGALAVNAARTDPAVVRAYLDSIRPALDIDGNGATDALTDGLLAIRYLFGMRGAALSDGAVALGATRGTAAEIQAYLLTLMP